MHDGHESGGAANEMKREAIEEENIIVKKSSSSENVKMEFISETSSCASTKDEQQMQMQVQETNSKTSPKTEAEQMCAGCRAPIKDKFLFSVIDLLWHANCVQCCVCSRQLNDRCFTYDNKLYCSHDYWRRFGPKCYACREPIEKSELVQRIKGSRVYHLKCFTCAHCKRRLEQGEQLHLVDNEQRLLCKHDFVQHVAASGARPSKPMVRCSNSGAFSLTLLNDRNSTESSQAAQLLSAKKQQQLKRSSLTALDNMLGRRRAEGEEEDEDEEQQDDDEEEEADDDDDDDEDELDEDELTRELDADELAASCFEDGQNDENNHARRQSSSAILAAGAIGGAGAAKKRRRRRRLDASASSQLVASGKARAKRNGESILNASAAQQQQQQQSASSILANMQPTSGSSSSPSSTSSSSASNHSTASSNSTSALHSHHPHHHAHQQHPHHAHSSVVPSNQQQQQQQQQLSSSANHQTSGAPGGGHKPTRVRTVLNEKQLQTLRDCYGHNPRPDALMKEQLVDMTGLSPRVIRVWFQNKRCKDKKKSILYKQMQQHEKDGRHLAGLTHIRGVSMVASSPIQFGDEAPIADLQAEVGASPTQQQQQQSVQSPTGNSKTTTTTTNNNATTAQNNSPALDIHAYQPPWKGLVEYAKDSTIAQQPQQQQQPDPSSPRYQQLIGQIHGYQTTTANEHQEAHQVIDQQQQPQFPANNYQMAPPAPAHLHHLHHAHPVTQPQALPPPPLPIGHHQLHQFQQQQQ